MAGVYFITPSNESVSRLIDDFQGSPLYQSAHVFFSSPAPQTVLAAIRSCPGLTSIQAEEPQRGALPFCSSLTVFCASMKCRYSHQPSV